MLKDLTEQLIKMGVNSVLTGVENIGKSRSGSAVGDAGYPWLITANTTLTHRSTRCGRWWFLIGTLTGNTAVYEAQATSTLAQHRLD